MLIAMLKILYKQFWKRKDFIDNMAKNSLVVWERTDIMKRSLQNRTRRTENAFTSDNSIRIPKYRHTYIIILWSSSSHWKFTNVFFLPFSRLTNTTVLNGFYECYSLISVLSGKRLCLVNLIILDDTAFIFYVMRINSTRGSWRNHDILKVH